MMPIGDETRRPSQFPTVTASIIGLNVVFFMLELANGDASVRHWSVIPAHIVAGRDLVTLLTAMFLHGSWSHIIGNMIFLWAFGPEIEDAMGPFRYLMFYLMGGVVAMLAQIAADPGSTVPNLGASGAIAAVMEHFWSRIRATRFVRSFSLDGFTKSRSYRLRCLSAFGF